MLKLKNLKKHQKNSFGIFLRVILMSINSVPLIKILFIPN